MKTRLCGALALAIALVAAFGAVALAHAQLTSADPAQGDTIKTPYSLSATFDDALTPDGSSIVIVDANGTTVASGTVSTSDDHTMTAELPLLPDGGYEVKWTAVSADDKAVERGLYQFQVSASASAAPPTQAPASAAASAAPATHGPTPVPSATNGSGGGGGNDLLIAIVLAVVIIGGVAGFVLYRNRR